MARFTGGRASYTRRLNTGNYEHKEFTAEISWSADDGEDHKYVLDAIERASQTAVSVVHRHLGIAMLPPVAPDEHPSPAELTPAANMARAEEELAVEAPKAARGRKPRAVDTEAIEAGKAALARLKARETVLELTDALPEDHPAVVDANTLGGHPHDDDEIDLSQLTGIVTIDNDQLLAELYKHAKRAGVPACQIVLGKYAPQLPMVPQERRAALVAEWEALPAKAA